MSANVHSPSQQCTVTSRESQVANSGNRGRKAHAIRPNYADPEVLWINTSEAAAIAGVDINTIYTWTTRYRPRYIMRKRGQYRIYKPAFLSFLESR